MSVHPQSLSFGKVNAVKDFPWQVILHNSSNKPLTVKSLQASCGCTSIDVDEVVVQPGKDARIRLVLDLTNAKPAALEEHFEVIVSGVVNGIVLRFPVTGVVTHKLWCDTTYISQSFTVAEVAGSEDRAVASAFISCMDDSGGVSACIISDAPDLPFGVSVSSVEGESAKLDLYVEKEKQVPAGTYRFHLGVGTGDATTSSDAALVLAVELHAVGTLCLSDGNVLIAGGGESGAWNVNTVSLTGPDGGQEFEVDSLVCRPNQNAVSVERVEYSRYDGRFEARVFFQLSDINETERQAGFLVLRDQQGNCESYRIGFTILGGK
ncbi:DUF1573 domain-containing protein [Roseimaritima sediminicola]|uniref:DUF1573 domain-containing protein n=1 Tax=Roseimaritima sediminicola TaxID=2662066 RepID=UPI001386AE12|nr:DUF1573 domain-containing protein [Roseimaritima sediminicola]